MNTEELAALTPEEKRIKIAEACGWHSIKQCTCKCQPHGLPEGVTAERQYKHLPDYLNSLDAMAQAEAVLNTTDNKARFASALRAAVYDGLAEWKPMNSPDLYWIELPPSSTFDLIHATAAQRADSFLRSLP